MRVLLVEDEDDLRILIAERLIKEGYAVDECADGDAALDYIRIGNYDGVIMDIMLPGQSGLEIIHKMRQSGIMTPVLILSALSDTENIVMGLDGGADDYLIKPFDFEILTARLRVMLRKSVGIHETVYRVGDLEINDAKKMATRGGVKLELTAREYAILLFLARNPGMVFTREQIISGVWNNGEDLTSNVVDVYIRFLRKKVDDPFDEKILTTVRGIGYCLKKGAE